MGVSAVDLFEVFNSRVGPALNPWMLFKDAIMLSQLNGFFAAATEN